VAVENWDSTWQGEAGRAGPGDPAQPLDALRNALQAQMLDSIGQAVIATDLEGRVVYANRMADELYGWPRGGMLGLPAQQVAVPPGAQEQAGAIMRELAAGGAFSGEFEVRRRDGSTFPAHVTNTHFRAADGRLAGIVGISFDLTERKQWERRIGEANEALRRVNQCAEAIVVASGPNGAFFQQITAGVAAALDACAAFVAVPAGPAGSGFRSLAAVRLGVPVAEFGFELDATPFTADTGPVWELALDGGGDCDACSAWPLLAGAGARVCVGVGLRGAGGRMLGVAVFGFARGVERQDTVASVLRMFAVRAAAELERRHADAQMRWQAALLDQAREAIVVADMDGRIRYWNKGAQRLLGWTAAEAIGRDVVDVVQADRRDYAHALRQVLATGEFTAEFEAVDKAGRPLALERRWTLVRDADGQPAGVLAIVNDIGERRRARAELQRLNAELETRVGERTRQLERANQELERANRELEAFSASVSHDLRAPLAAIGGFAELLQSVAGDTLPERGAHALRRIRAGARQMESLIEGLLSLARVSRDELRLQEVDLSGLAADVQAELQAAQPRAGVEVRIQPGLRVRGDARLLRQVLANLLGNAWKFTSRQPAARIEFGREEGEYFVRDDGPGFEMAYAHRLFGAFQRLHSASEYPGNGIGLATVRRVVERHGGTIRGESGAGGGACFRFTLAAG
jgi:PAS domain S-box-containing protein